MGKPKEPDVKRYIVITDQVGDMQAGYRDDYSGEDRYSLQKTKGSSSYSPLRMSRREAEDAIVAMQNVIRKADEEADKE